MKQSLTNTKDESPNSLPEVDDAGDLEGFQPSPPAHRIDDKAATLEDELQDLKLRFGRERFMYIFIITTLTVVLVGPSITNNFILGFFVIAALIFVIAMGKYLDFPWAVLPLERWHDLLYKACERKFLGNGKDTKTEPIDDGNDT